LRRKLNKQERAAFKRAILNSLSVGEWEEKIIDELEVDPWQVTVILYDDVLDPRLDHPQVVTDKIDVTIHASYEVGHFKVVTPGDLPHYYFFVLEENADVVVDPSDELLEE
jgi:hypothetical protein